MANRWGNNGNSDRLYLLGMGVGVGAKITAGDDCSHEIKGCLLLGSEAMTSLNSILKSWDITLPIKVWYSQSYGLSSSHIWIWELDHKKGWQLKYWCFWTGEVELFFLIFEVGEDPWEFLGNQGDQTTQSSRKSTLNIHWKDWCWSWISNSLTTWCEELTHWKRPWCWERLKAGG